ncbi:MAG: hypothetical protein ABIP64_11595, partial [Burkholderiales bacterium]
HQNHFQPIENSRLNALINRPAQTHTSIGMYYEPAGVEGREGSIFDHSLKKILPPSFMKLNHATHRSATPFGYI